MLPLVRSLVLAGGAVLLLAGDVVAADRQAPPPTAAPNFCDVYGPGYRAVGGMCIKISGSIDVSIGMSSSGGKPSAATSTDWIRAKTPPPR
jgi:hypothetical protein